MKNGTPKTLREACRLGLEKYYADLPVDNGTLDLHVANAVKDFLSQHFTTAYLKAHNKEHLPDLKELFTICTFEPRSRDNKE